MKTISIIQPWATLIMIGEKNFETRSWATKYRGELGIHASKKVDKRICEQEPFKSILDKYGYEANNLPIGLIIGVCNLQQCYKIRRPTGAEGMVFLDIVGGRSIGWGGFMPNEYHFGDYTEGRFAWEMSDVKQIEPIPAKGQLGLWNYNVEK
jgi:hypothetical protein